VDDGEMVQRIKNLVAVLARMNGKISGRDLDALQQCLWLAESVPGLREGLVQVRLAEDAVRQALRQYGEHAEGCRRSPCSCGLWDVLGAGTGPDPLAYLLLLRELASAVRRCEKPIPEGLWDAAGKVARWGAAHRGMLQLLAGVGPANGSAAG
jgi:hypothetical protein